MKLSLPAFRVTSDDLPDADKKTMRAVQPLLDALNRCLTAAIQVLNGVDLPAPKASSFTTDSSGVAYVDLKLDTTPSELWVTGLTQAEGVMNFVYGYSWIPLTKGARLLFIGLAASTTYSLKVRYL